MHRSLSDDEEPLEDKTVAIPLHSKKTERRQRKKEKKEKKQQQMSNFSELPAELLLEIFEYLKPSDVISLSMVNSFLYSLVRTKASSLGTAIVQNRYGILARCLPLPVLLSNVEFSAHALLNDPERRHWLHLHKDRYQHIRNPDGELVCTCYNCIVGWFNLGLVLDFAHWQSNLDNGEPIPILPRGQVVPWNQELLERNAIMIRKALASPLWYARILETHLASTVRSIRRQKQNKGNKRKHVEMTEEDAAAGTDRFLERKGPLTLQFPVTRDEYYMLEAFLPNRVWIESERRWLYTPAAAAHKTDLGLVTCTVNKEAYCGSQNDLVKTC